jgi:GNAT superfamily N-acetyltransferase
MPDMLVPLLKLPAHEPLIQALRDKHDVIIRRANAHEITPVRDFVHKTFSIPWADEILVGFSRQPISVYIAIERGKVIGFGAYECTRRAFFGPTGVRERSRGKGIGTALLIACLAGLREVGYAYGIIGGAGPVEFYAKTVNATVIPDSTPGVYADPLARKRR